MVNPAKEFQDRKMSKLIFWEIINQNKPVSFRELYDQKLNVSLQKDLKDKRNDINPVLRALRQKKWLVCQESAKRKQTFLLNELKFKQYFFKQLKNPINHMVSKDEKENLFHDFILYMCGYKRLAFLQTPLYVIINRFVDDVLLHYEMDKRLHKLPEINVQAYYWLSNYKRIQTRDWEWSKKKSY